ncbi:PadR family transcriptional regulator [Nonomuraea sp. NPDC049152]|uniref:PadR family transcriptional regulator n=1 Tax=Nonomuraea sp. NPDC049152 TaxID=3154350 RepID=UPI0033F31762
MKLFDVSLANVWPATQSQLYGELGKLADSGLITVTAEGPRGRKEYAITEEGTAELRHWMTEVPPLHAARSDLLLRVFFLGQLSPGEARDYLREQGAVATSRHEALEGIRAAVEEGDDNLSVYGRIVLEWGLRFTTTQREWAEWAEQQIR